MDRLVVVWILDVLVAHISFFEHETLGPFRCEGGVGRADDVPDGLMVLSLELKPEVVFVLENVHHVRHLSFVTHRRQLDNFVALALLSLCDSLRRHRSFSHLNGIHVAAQGVFFRLRITQLVLWKFKVFTDDRVFIDLRWIWVLLIVVNRVPQVDMGLKLPLDAAFTRELLLIVLHLAVAGVRGLGVGSGGVGGGAL
jgi:hypothetical protein